MRAQGAQALAEVVAEGKQGLRNLPITLPDPAAFAQAALGQVRRKGGASYRFRKQEKGEAWPIGMPPGPGFSQLAPLEARNRGL